MDCDSDGKGLRLCVALQVFTMDEKLSEAVTEAFVRMHEKKLIYRSNVGDLQAVRDPYLMISLAFGELVLPTEICHLRNRS